MKRCFSLLIFQNVVICKKIYDTELEMHKNLDNENRGNLFYNYIHLKLYEPTS